MAMTPSEYFYETYEIVKMNNKSLTIQNKRTYERLFVSAKVFNSILMNQDIERFTETEIHMPNGRTTKWLGIVTTMVF
jgi:hypothetical protein